MPDFAIKVLTNRRATLADSLDGQPMNKRLRLAKAKTENADNVSEWEDAIATVEGYISDLDRALEILKANKDN